MPKSDEGANSSAQKAGQADDKDAKTAEANSGESKGSEAKSGEGKPAEAKASESGAPGKDQGQAGQPASASTGQTSGQSSSGSSSSQAATQSQSQGQSQTQSGQQQQQDGGAIALLKADHRKVDALFTQFEQAGDDRDRKDDLVEQICRELVVHTLIEEQVFYPACRRAASDEEPLDEAQVEHDSAKMLIADLMFGDPDDDYRDAKVKVLAEQIRHHVREEEAPQGVFAKAREAGVDTPELADRLKQLKQQLMARPDRLAPSRPVSFEAQPGAFARQNQERTMARNQDRDDRGRFSDDDDDRGGRGGGGRGHGGWFGDPEGHSQAARQRGGESRSYMSGRDDDDRGGRGGGGRGGDRDRDDQGRFMSDDDRGGRGGGRGGGGRGQGGWFGDPEGHSQASREGWRNSPHEGSGWYGDPQGHSQASREGWRNSPHEGSGWYGDPQGHSQASREGWRNSPHEGSGWYGDPEGHSRASREGWRHSDHEGSGWRGDPQGHSEAARRGWEDGHRGQSRAGGRDDDRGGRGGGGGRDDDRGGRGGGGRGHGGWFGDPEGHSEAARRGRDDRR